MRKSTLLRLATFSATLLVVGHGGFAQHVTSARPGLVYRVEGPVFVNKDRLDTTHAILRHATSGDLLRTHRGRAELLLGDTTVLRTGGISALRFDSLELGRAEIQLVGGAVVLDLADEFGRESVAVRVRDAVIEVKKLGVYRIDLLPDHPPSVRVFQGVAAVTLPDGARKVKKGRRLELSPSSEPRRFEASRFDELDLWAANRRIELVRELVAAAPRDPDARRRPSSGNALESLRAIRRRKEAEIRSSEAADSLWVK